MKHPTRPYLRPEEPPDAFDKLAEDWHRHFHPADPESETLVNALIYIDWRIHRYRLDVAVIEQVHDNPGQPGALQTLHALIESLEQIGCWTMNSLSYLQRVHTLDASESIDSIATSAGLGSFHHNAHIPAPLPPKTKPN